MSQAKAEHRTFLEAQQAGNYVRKVRNAFETMSREEQVAMKLRYGTEAEWYRKVYRPKEVKGQLEEIKETIRNAVLWQKKVVAPETLYKIILERYKERGYLRSYSVGRRPEHHQLLLYLDFFEKKAELMLDMGLFANGHNPLV